MVMLLRISEWPVEWAGAASTTVDHADIPESTQPGGCSYHQTTVRVAALPLSRPRVAPIGFDPVAGFGGNQGWGNHLAVILTLLEMAIDHVTAWPSLIDEPQLQVGLGQLFDEFVQGIERAADRAVELGYRVACLGGRRHD